MNELQLTLLAMGPILESLNNEELAWLSLAASLNEKPVGDFDTELNTCMIESLFDSAGKMHDLTRQAITLYAKRSLGVSSEQV